MESADSTQTSGDEKNTYYGFGPKGNYQKGI